LLHTHAATVVLFLFHNDSQNYKPMKIKRTLPLLLAVIMLLFHACQQSQPAPPNIIFLLTDDQRWDALGAMGNEIIQTPNLDRLANEGVLFTNAHVTTSICCCSRASILTGQYVSRHGINDFMTDLIGEALEQTYPLLLKNQAGYKIGFIGKYGIGLENRPADRFDYWTCEKVLQPSYENEDKDGNYLHYTDKVQQDIMGFLENFGGQTPFCLSVSFKAPHVQDGDARQFIYPPRYKDLYADVEIPLPETAGQAYWDFFPEDFRTNNEARIRWELRFPNPEKYQESVRGYYRLIKGVDDVVGNLVTKLQDLGIADNTIIMLMGDNGFYLAEHGMAGKWYAHEESIRVPLFIYDPRLPVGSRGLKKEEMVLNIDVAPTILSLAGLQAPAGMQGQDLTRLYEADHGGDRWRHEYFYEHTVEIPTIRHSLAVVTEDHKYITYPGLASGFEEFYDLKADPHEKKSLIDDPAYRDTIRAYRERLEKLREQVK
jgi:arylsulfatase A-like enzyme